MKKDQNYETFNKVDLNHDLSDIKDIKTFKDYIRGLTFENPSAIFSNWQKKYLITKTEEKLTSKNLNL